MNSYFTLIVPSDVGMPTNDVSGLEMECNQFCNAKQIKLLWSSSDRKITFTGAVSDESSYVTAPGPL